MTLFVHTDESGVFDSVNNDYFVFAGILMLSKESKDIAERQYLAVEKIIRQEGGYNRSTELKASLLSNREKGKIMRSLNNELKFAVIINQKNVTPQIFKSKKDKQRYLDYALKIALKRFILHLSGRGILDLAAIEYMYLFCDEHNTATNGRYELEEGLLAEFKNGTYNFNYQTFFPPTIHNLKHLSVEFCASEKRALVRAADIIANHVYSSTVRKCNPAKPELFITNLP